MKKTILAAALLCAALASCKDTVRKESPTNQTPEALQDPGLSSDIRLKRNDGNMMESMYNELAAKDPDLKKLEKELADLPANKSDSLEAFQDYQQKNERYYASLDRPALSIRDSVTRVRIIAMIAASKANYQLGTNPHQALLKAMEEKELRLSDLHTILKITRTLPLIEQYQKDRLPATAPLQAFYTQLEQAVGVTDSLGKK